MRKSFSVLAWKDAGGTFFPDGITRTISCNHIKEGDFGLALYGEIVPLPTTTLPVDVAGTDLQHRETSIPPGTVLLNTTQFTDSGYKQVTRIKDLDTLQITYVDTTDYATQVDTCNDCCIPGTCNIVTPSVSGTPGTTTATIVWTAPTKAPVGYEYNVVANSGTCLAPTIGIFVDVATASLTGLTANTTYCFAVRVICGTGNYSGWNYVQFTTHA